MPHPWMMLSHLVGTHYTKWTLFILNTVLHVSQTPVIIIFSHFNSPHLIQPLTRFYKGASGNDSYVPRGMQTFNNPIKQKLIQTTPVVELETGLLTQCILLVT